MDCALTAYVPPRLAVRNPGDPCGPGLPVEEVRFTYRDWTVRF
jgi:hypothetical protein